MFCYINNILKGDSNIDIFTNTYDPNSLVNDFNLLEQTMSDPEQLPSIENDFLYLAQKKKLKLGVFQLFSTMWGLALIDLFHHLSIPVITEVDDYAFGVNTDNVNYESFNPDSDVIKIIKAQLKDSDALIVSTQELKEKYSYLNDKIYIVPNSIDFKFYSKLKNNKHKSYINIGWQGASGHKRDLEIIEPVVHRILKKYKNVRFTFLGGAEGIPESFRNNKRIKLKNMWITVEKFRKFKAKEGFDIELAPLFDTEFNRCKSNLRYLEASALKIPTVASDVGPYKDAVAELCTEESEWYTTLCTLIGNPEYRKSLGKKAYRDVKKHYNLIDVTEKYLTVLNAEISEHQKRIKRFKAVTKDLKVD